MCLKSNKVTQSISCFMSVMENVAVLIIDIHVRSEKKCKGLVTHAEDAQILMLVHEISLIRHAGFSV